MLGGQTPCALRGASVRFPRFVRPAAVATAALVLAAPPASAADTSPDPDVLGFPAGLTCVGTTVSGAMRVHSSKFSAGRIQLMYNVGGNKFDKVLATRNFIVTKGNVDYPFSIDISTAPAGTVNFVAIGTAGEDVVDTAQSKGLRAADCTRPTERDTTAPTTEISLPATPPWGWYADSVPVTFTASDGGSGVDKTYYSVDGGPEQEWTGVFDHTLGGSHTISYWSVDVAGNEEPHKSQQFKVDTASPTIEGTRTPAANGSGWNNTDVKVSFTCADADSGVVTGGCTPGTPLTNEGADQWVRGTVTDNVGKTSSTTVADINIDKTPPTLTAVRKTPSNAAGWSRRDVTVDWVGSDTLSRIDPRSQPGPSIMTGEGADLRATASIKDLAGNTGQGSISGISIDRTQPTITGAIVRSDGAPRSANAAGWFRTQVRVRYEASDSLSGVQQKSGDTVLLDDGAGLSATGTARDKAGNTSSVTVSGIKIDSQAPQTTASNLCDEQHGWCKGESATVNLAAQDQSGLSGVKEIRYAVNGAKEQTASGANTRVTVPLAAGTVEATVEYYAVDNAGNAEAKRAVSLFFNDTAPTVSHTLAPEANAAGWNNSDTTVHFSAKDAGSGVDAATVTPDVKVTDETSGLTVHGTAKDLAGNTGTDDVTVRLDKSAPVISAAVEDGRKGANGYYTGPVTVGFTCSDTLSGVATCPADVFLASDGEDQKVTGEAIDNAGNKASATVAGISIDSTKPEITVAGVKASYTLGEATGIRCTATDATSGVNADGCKVTVSDGTSNGVGTFTYNATATDRAGNVATTSGEYKVLYAWSGFLQPINDTAHDLGKGVSVFKGGSTVPVKFQLRNAAGQVVQGDNVQWMVPAKGSRITAGVDDSQYQAPATR